MQIVFSRLDESLYPDCVRYLRMTLLIKKFCCVVRCIDCHSVLATIEFGLYPQVPYWLRRVRRRGAIGLFNGKESETLETKSLNNLSLHHFGTPPEN